MWFPKMIGVVKDESEVTKATTGHSLDLPLVVNKIALD